MVHFQEKEDSKLKMEMFMKAIFCREINKDLEENISTMDNNIKDFLRQVVLMVKV